MLITHSLSSLVSAQKPGHLLWLATRNGSQHRGRTHRKKKFKSQVRARKKIDRFGLFLDPWTHMFRYPSDTPLRPLFRPARTNIY